MKKALDLFCCAGGAGMGLHCAGFEVTGVDINPQPNYPFKFIQGDALTHDLSGYDLVWASPPCQRFTKARKLRGNEHPDLVAPMRERLQAAGVPWIIENVPGAPLRNPIELCGLMFGLNVYRHRLFESSLPLCAPLHPSHHRKQVKMGRPVKDGDIIQVVGHFSNVPYARKAMCIEWMNQRELAQAIPPAYSEYLAGQILQGSSEPRS
jgi:DNA (cytosine-5)-methyltransferase 1